MNAAIFLDRDNTLIYADTDVADPSQVRLLQGVPSGIASLRGLGYRIIVVTNQDGIANGRYTESAADAVHMKINEQIGNISGTSIDRFYYCPFHPDAILERYRKDHPWRKPNPGMIQQAGKDMDIDLSASWLISTDKADIKTAYAAGVRMLLLTSEAVDMIPLKMEEIFITQTRALAARELDGPYFSARNLVEAVRVIAQQRRPDFPEERVIRDRFGRKVEVGGQKPKPQFQGEAPTPLFTGAHIETPAPVVPAVHAVQAVEQPPLPAPTPESEPEPELVAAQPPAPTVAEIPPAPAPQISSPEPEPEPEPELDSEPMLIPSVAMPELADNQDDDDDAPPLETQVKAEPELKQEETIFAQTAVAPQAKANESQPPARPASQPKLAVVPKPKPAPQPVAAVPADDSAEAASNADPIDLPPEIEKLPPVEIQFQRMESSLRQILHEIRTSREVVTDTSFTAIIAMILQGLAIILMAGALFQPTDNFIRWVMCAIVLQLASMTAMLIKR